MSLLHPKWRIDWYLSEDRVDPKGEARLRAHLAAPYGDMMLTGCFGLVRAFAHRVERWQSEIAKALAA